MIKHKLKQKIFLTAAIFIAFFAFSAMGADANEMSPESVVKLVNKSRKAEGLGILSSNYKLIQAAQMKAEDMFNNNYFAHTSPDGVTPWHWFDVCNYEYKYAGENLAINFNDAESQHDAWMKSSTHRKNILNPAYQEIGVAVKKGTIDGHSATITVQEFGAKNTDLISMVSGAESELYRRSIIYKENAPENKQVLKLASAKLQPSGGGLLRSSSNQTEAAYQNKKFQESFAWITVSLILILVVAINTRVVSGIIHRKPFAAFNVLIMMVILTTAVFWRA